MSKNRSTCLRTDQGFLVECGMTTDAQTAHTLHYQTVCILFLLVPWKTNLNRLLNKKHGVCNSSISISSKEIMVYNLLVLANLNAQKDSFNTTSNLKTLQKYQTQMPHGTGIFAHIRP